MLKTTHPLGGENSPTDVDKPQSTAEIARYRAAQDDDLAMGHVAQSVYKVMKRETEAASAACSGGWDGQAKAMVAASERRHGYLANL